MTLEKILLREKVITLIRSFFVQNNFQEITLPVLYTSLPHEQNVYPFTTKWKYHQDNLYLATSPETGLKRLLCQTPLNNCFAIAPSFRDLEAKGPTHQPEFLMLEWYRLDSDYREIMTDSQNLIIYLYNNLGLNKNNSTNNLLTYQDTSFDLSFPWPQITLEDLFLKYTGKSLPSSEPEINQVFLNQIDPLLSQLNTPLFITDYPQHMSPLAHPIDHSDKAQRFELYFGNLEIANGCTENLHPAIDTPWKNLPPSAGCGLGIDRLTMLFSNSSVIEEVRPLPL